ncbi:MAG: tRNA (adenosine(37)-N6)-threonylcarbamoyltransferase complex dimerization subunit type 1 TsaB [Pseudomonadota bacterium]
MILGIDTSAGRCGVALVSDGMVLAELSEVMERGHAERLFPLIEAVLQQAGAAVQDLKRIAVCTGPGSFTGLRIGVAAARGLALGRGVPAIGITRFEAVAAGVTRPQLARSTGADDGPTESDPPASSRSQPRSLQAKVGWAETRPVAVALAGRGAVFLQCFAPDMVPLAKPALVAVEALSAQPDRDVRIGDGWSLAGLTTALASAGHADPAIVAGLAAERTPGALPAPLYLREADAALPSEAPPVLLD